MQTLEQSQSVFMDFFKRAKVNPELEALERHKIYKVAVKKFDRAMKAQVRELLASDLFENIDNRIGKAEDPYASSRILTESDEEEIYDAVQQTLPPLKERVDPSFLIGLFVWLFNFGGQSFFDKHSIPREFNLRNPDIIKSLEVRSDLLLAGLDETTTKWVARQITNGREDGLSIKQIADRIKDRVPQTYANRAETIVYTESSDMIGRSELEAATRNGASHKQWVTVGDDRVDEDCEMNERAGNIGIGQNFPSGVSRNPAHPRCRCWVEFQFTPFQGFVWAGQ